MSNTTDFSRFNWKPVTEEVTLPSGRVAIVKAKIDSISMILHSGAIPDSLADVFMAGFKGERRSGWQISKNDLPAVNEMMNTVAAAVLIMPKVVQANPRYDKGECLLEDITFEDKQWLFSRAMGSGGDESSKMNTFPPESSGSPDTSPAS